MVANYSYHTVILVFLQTLFTSNRMVTVRLGWRDNADPRLNIADMEKSGKYSQALIRKLRRRDACHQNCWEALGIFCAGVVCPSLCHQCLLTLVIPWPGDGNAEYRYRYRLTNPGVQVAGNQAGLSASYMTKMSSAFFVIRCAYSMSPPLCSKIQY